MTSFVAVFTGVGLAVAQAGEGSASNRQLATDIRTGVLFTLLASFTVVACSIGVNQAAAVLDRRDVWVALDRMGVPRPVMHAARGRAVLGPLLLAALGSAAVAAVVVFPVTGYAMVTRPLTVLVIAGCLVAGMTLVVVTLLATRPVLTRVLARPERG